MRHTFTILFVLLTALTFAQSWLDDNPSWHYDYFAPFTEAGYYKINTLGDTVILGKTCTKLEVRKASRPVYQFYTPEEVVVGYHYIYSNADTLSVFTGDDFQVLYDFSLAAGDTLQVLVFDIYNSTRCTDVTIPFLIDSTGTTEINGVPLRTQAVRPILDGEINYLEAYPTTFVERLGAVAGNLSYLFYNEILCQGTDYPSWTFRCYDSASISYHTVASDSCDYIEYVDLSFKWFENNPKWTYGLYFPFTTPGYEEMTVGKDTVINGQACKRLDRWVVTAPYTGGGPFFDTRHEYAYQEGKAIYVYENERFQKLYDFSMSVGDTLSLNLSHYYLDSIIQYRVDSIGLFQHEGRELEFQKVQLLNNPILPPEYSIQDLIIIEGIGAVEPVDGDEGFAFGSYFFFYRTYSHPVDGPNWHFRCFESDVIPFYKKGLTECDFLLVATQNVAPENLRIYPNPFTSEITIELEQEQLENVKVYSASGQLLQEIAANGVSTFATSISGLPKGFYIMEVITKSGKRGIRKLTKL